jgi:hypothetical protein
MKTMVLVSALILIFSQGCDRSKGKGSDREWQQKQEEQERQNLRDHQQQINEKNREVNFNPANN